MNKRIVVFEDDEKLFACIRAGADGYIFKKAQPQEMLNAIEDALNMAPPRHPVLHVKYFVSCTFAKSP